MKYIKQLILFFYLRFLRIKKNIVIQALNYYFSITKKTYFNWKIKGKTFRVFLPQHELAERASMKFNGGIKEFSIISEIIQKHCGEKPIIFIVGSNVGLVEMPASMSKDATIYSFEPIPDTFEFLKKNVEYNKIDNVRLHNMGISNVSGKLPIGVGDDSEHSSIVFTDNKNEILCDFITLAEYFSENHITGLDFLKIDAEGHDIEVLKSGEDLVRKFKPVIQIEIAKVPSTQVNEAYDTEWLESFMDELDYSYFEVYRGQLVPIANLNQFLGRPVIQNDLLLLPNSRN